MSETGSLFTYSNVPKPSQVLEYGFFVMCHKQGYFMYHKYTKQR